jgi:hypothetical protein
MIVKIRDEASLRAIQPRQLMTYLERKGWHEARRFAKRGSVWVSQLSSGEEFEILLPLALTLRDYVARMIDILDTLEIVEGRSQPAILSDITAINI